MPLIWAGVGAAGAGLAKGLQSPSTPDLSHFTSKNAFFKSRLQRLMAIGGNLSPISRAEYKKLPASNRFKFGGKFFSGEQVSAQALEEAEKNFTARRFQLQRDDFKKLKDSPLYDALFADSQNPPNLFAGGSNFLEAALGGATQQGINMNDPRVQAKIGGQAAVQANLQSKALQRQSGMSLAQALQGPGSSSAGALGNAPGVEFFNNNFLQLSQLHAQGQFAKANAKNEQQGAVAGGLMGIGGGLLGAGLLGGAPTTPGAQLPPQYNNIGSITSGQFLRPYGYSPAG
jgi:hypothetical protein